ncbi:MAG: thioesterase domain-containing protein, partial [Tumebacillaceae bacterium]
FGGEALAPYLLQEWKHKYPETKLINMYGITETTIHATYKEFSDEEIARNVSNIGVALPGLSLYLLDEDRNLKPAGAIGEIYVGGAAVVRGYIKRPELNAERFVTHPQLPAERLYKTGDLARLLPSGDLEYMGRIDHQVKIRGHRVELGEIESAVVQHEHVDKAIVLAREDKQGSKLLVAYVVARAGVTLRLDDMRDYLRSKLPSYAVPSVFHFLADFPTNSNGKIDRASLPGIEDGMQDSRNYVAPRNAMELRMAHIWEEVLQTQPIGVLDHFFDVGGTSIRSLSLMNLVRERFQVDLPLSALFTHSTIAGLCEAMQGTMVATNNVLIPIQKGTGEQPPLFLLPPLGGGALIYLPLVQELGPEHTIYGLQAVGYEDEEAPQTTIEEMADRYLTEILAVSEGPYRLVGYSFGGTVAYEVARRLEQLGKDVSFLGMVDAYPIRFREEGEKYEPTDKTQSLLVRTAKEALGLNIESLVEMDQDVLIQMILEGAIAQNYLPRYASTDTIHKKVELMLAGDTAMRLFQPIPQPISATIHVFLGESSSTEGNPLLSGAGEWANRTTGAAHMHLVPGDHYDIVMGENAKMLGAAFKKVLNPQNIVVSS